MAELHMDAELRSLAIANYETWVPEVTEAIRPAMTMWDRCYANLNEEIIVPEEPRLHYGLYTHGELRAFATLATSDDLTEMKLLNLAVPPTMHRRGWGSAMLTLCEVIFSEVGYNRLTLFTPAPSRVFYEKCGYIPHVALNEEDRKDSSRRDIGLHMTKQLHRFGRDSHDS